MHRRALALGRHADVVPELDALVREQPYRERFRERLMLALYRSGRQADALRVFREGRRLLAELGTEPGRELRRLELAILRQDTALDLPDASGAARGRRESAAAMHERFAEWLARRGEGDSPEWELELSGHPPAEFIGEMCAYLAA